ncbi:MAG: hypothetical protein QW100_02290, partial [Thermoplasmatales archaeon]
ITSPLYLQTNTPIGNSSGYGYTYYLPQPVAVSSVATMSFQANSAAGYVKVYDDAGHYIQVPVTTGNSSYTSVTITNVQFQANSLSDIDYVLLPEAGPLGDLIQNIVISASPPTPFSISLMNDSATLYPIILYNIPANATSATLIRNGSQVTNLSLISTSYEDNSLISAGSYQYYILATNNGGQTASNIVTFNTPVVSTPNLQGSLPQFTNQVSLSWSGVSNATILDLYRNGSLLIQLSPNCTTYQDTLTTAGTYSYYIQAVNPYGYAASNIVTVTYAPVPPQPPTLTETLIGQNVVQLNWSSGAYTQSVIYRNGTSLATLAAPTETYQDTLSSAGTYTYYVQVSNPYGYAASNTATVSVQAPGPFAITVGTSPSGYYPVVNYWLPSGVTSAQLYRNGQLVGPLSLTATQYTDTGISAAGTYSYYVLAYNSVGSTASNIVDFTTSPPPAVNISGTVTGGITANLSWNEITCDGYYVYRGTTQIAQLSANVTTYEDTMPDSSDTYYVVAYNPFGQTASNQIKLLMTGPGAFNINIGLDPSGWYPNITFALPTGTTSAAIFRNGQQISSISLSQTNYYDFSIDSPGTYSYYVTAYNASGATASNIVTFTASLAKAPVLGLTPNRSQPNQVTLGWTDPDVTSYNVLENGTVVATEDPTTTTYTTTVSGGNTTFQVQAVNPYGVATSNTVTYNPATPPPQLAVSFGNIVSWAALIFGAIFGLLALWVGYYLVRRYLIPLVFSAARVPAQYSARDYKVEYITPDSTSYVAYVAKDYKAPEIPATLQSKYKPKYTPGSGSSEYKPPHGEWGSYKPKY